MRDAIPEAMQISRRTRTVSIPGAQFVVDTEGKKTAVLLSVRQYEKLLEDLHDLAVIAARRDEAPMTFEDIKQRLQEDGLV